MAGASPTAGSTCATCLRKFTVHFRTLDVDDNIKVPGIKNPVNNFDGTFGFDWMRNEYIYPMTLVDGKRLPILISQLPKLMASYNEGIQLPIKPFGSQYIPAWLAIFSDKNSDKINKGGVFLDLEILQNKHDDINKLTNDGTKLFFVSSSKYIKISPNIIDLNSLIQRSRIKRILNSKNNIFEYFYANLRSIKISCEGGVLSKHEEINVYASRGSGSKELVGKLMVYKNNNIPLLELTFVNVITNNLPINKPSHYEYHLKYKSFNQALVRAERRLETNFDLVVLSKNNKDIADFLKKVNVSSSPKADELDATDISNELIDLFDKYGGKYRPNDGKNNLTLNKSGHQRTYIFYTNIKAGSTNGIAPGTKLFDFNMNNFGWGNSVVIFQQAQLNNDTLVHEISHSLKLPHIFEYFYNSFQFRQGLTSNVMDYGYYNSSSFDFKKMNFPQLVNRKSRKYFSKTQWDLLRMDQSLIK